MTDTLYPDIPLFDEEEAAAWLAVSPEWLRAHDAELGAVSLGAGMTRYPAVGLVDRAIRIGNPV